MCHWKDIQLSKGQFNKKRLISADIAGKKIYYSSAPCLHVKVRPHKDCDYVVPIREHNLPLQRTSGRPVEFVYVHPKDPNDKRRVTVLSKGSIWQSPQPSFTWSYQNLSVHQVKNRFCCHCRPFPYSFWHSIWQRSRVRSFLLLSMELVVIQEKCLSSSRKLRRQKD